MTASLNTRTQKLRLLIDVISTQNKAYRYGSSCMPGNLKLYAKVITRYAEVITKYAKLGSGQTHIKGCNKFLFMQYLNLHHLVE